MKKAFNFRSVLVCVLVLIMCLTAFVACDKKQDLSGLENAKSQIYQTYKKLDNTTQASDFYLFKTIVVGEKTYNIDWSYKVLEGPEENVSLVLDSDKANFVKFAINGQATAETKFVISGYVKDEKGNKLVIAENGFTIKVPKFAVATYAEFVAMCKENGSSISASSKTCAVLAYIVGVNCNGSSMGSVWAMDKDGNGYYVYSPKYPEGFTKTREALNEYLPIGTEVVINGTPTLQFGATLQFNKNATIEKTGNTAADKNVTLDYIDATDAWSKATDIQDTALEGFQARRVELKGITMGRKEGNDWYFTVGGVEFICRSNIYLMTEADQKALEEKWVVGGKANLKGLVNVYSKKYQVYPDSVNALEVLTQTDEEAVAGVKASLALEATYEDNFTLPTSDAAVVTWAIKSGTGAAIGENNLVTITRANADQKVVFTATIKKGEVSDTKEFEITIPAIVVEDPNTVVLTTKSLKLENGKYQESPADGVTVNGVTFAFKEIGYYTDGIQMRQKDGVYSSLWNTTAFERAIASITFKLSSTKSVYDNANAFAIKFGNAADNLTETISFSTVKDQLEYTITPEGKDWTFMSFTKTMKDYTFYFESITINYALSDADAVVADKDALELEESYHSAFDLPLKGANGTTIAWATKTETTVVAIDAAGHVTINPVDPSTLITLVATISKGEAKATREFPITILKETPKYVISWTAGEHGTITSAKVGEADATSGAEFEDGTVITFVLAPETGYIAKYAIGEGAAVAVKGNTFTVTADEAKTIAITFVEQYAAKTIAEYKALTKETAGTEGYKLTGVVTSIDKKAAYIQDATGAAVYVFFGYTAPYSNTLKTLQIGKEYTICGYYDNYNGLVQLKTPVLSGEAKDPETAIVAKDLDEAAYKALTIGNSAELVNLKGLKVAGGKFMLGETAIAYYTGNVADANKSDLDAMVALLKDGVNFDLVNVNVCVNKNAVQIEIVRASSIVIDWAPVAKIDVAEIGINDIAQITVTASPAVATDIKATFVSDHPEIAKVDENGKVTGVAAGDAIITVTANGKTTTVAVKVVASVEKFAVNFTKTGTNGNITTVTVDGTEINPGDEVVKGKTIVVTVAPADGFRLASVTIGEGAADTSYAGKTSFELTITADTTFAVAFETIPAGPVVAASFALGDNGAATHSDGTDASTYEETVSGYTLSISAGSNFYTGAIDAQGNSCLKLGTSSKVGTFTITVPTGVKKVVIYVSGYKAKTSKYTVNGGDVKTATKKSNDGEYEAVEITVPEDGKIVFATVSGATRIMINTIEFYA